MQILSIPTEVCYLLLLLTVTRDFEFLVLQCICRDETGAGCVSAGLLGALGAILPTVTAICGVFPEGVCC